MNIGLMWPEFQVYMQVPGPNGGFRSSPVFKLPKRETLILVSGYNSPMRAAIIDRWTELEAQEPATARVPTNFREGLLLAAAQQEQLEEANALLAITVPEATVYDNVVDRWYLHQLVFCEVDLVAVNHVALGVGPQPFGH